MASKEQKIDFIIRASTDSGFHGTFSKAQESFIKLGKEIQNVQRIQRDVSSYQKQRAAVESASAKLENLQGQHDLLQKEIARTVKQHDLLQERMERTGGAPAPSRRKWRGLRRGPPRWNGKVSNLASVSARQPTLLRAKRKSSTRPEIACKRPGLIPTILRGLTRV